jgi:lambda family phage portal protein
MIIPRRPLGRVWQPEGGRPLPEARMATRRFAASQVDRLTAGWLATKNSLDHDLRSGLDRIRQRSRELFANNEYAIKFGRMVSNNVVGPEGFVLQSRPTDPDGTVDRIAAQAVERGWWRWMRPNHCEVTGRMGFADLCRLGLLALARDGEILWRKVRGAQAGEFGFQLQAIDIDRLDTEHNVPATGNGNAIVMGVEINRYGKPVAYHLYSAHPNDAHTSRRRERVPAGDMIHAFIPHGEGQTRGLPWMHASMRRMKDLDGYREAAVIAARVGAAKMGIWETPDGQPPGEDALATLDNHLASGLLTQEQYNVARSAINESNRYVTTAEPGQFDFAPPGYKLHTYDPTYPHDQFDAFCKEALRGISSGIGVAYNSLANDLEGVNFSSIRSGVLEERDGWMAIQNWFATNVLTPIFEEWLEMALLRERITLPSGRPLPLARFEKFAQHVWQPRRWGWVDPKKDIEAAILAIDARIASPQQITAQQGRDLEDVLDDLAAFEKMLTERNLQAPAPRPATAAPAPREDDDESA